MIPQSSPSQRNVIFGSRVGEERTNDPLAVLLSFMLPAKSDYNEKCFFVSLTAPSSEGKVVALV